MPASSVSIRRVAVFDFDQTLAVKEVSPWIDRARMVDLGFGGRERIEMLKAMLQGLAENGVAAVICSFNARDVIHSALNTTGLHEYFRTDLTMDREDAEVVKWRKNRVISNRILPALGILEGAGENILFADDDPSNVQHVQAALPRATTVKVPKGGLGQAHCLKILEWAQRGAAAGRAPSAQVEAASGADARGGGGGAYSGGDGAAARREHPRVVAAGAATSPQDAREAASAACPGFEPKRAGGPLALWCRRCGAHATEHTDRPLEDPTWVNHPCRPWAPVGAQRDRPPPEGSRWADRNQ